MDCIDNYGLYRDKKPEEFFDELESEPEKYSKFVSSNFKEISYEHLVFFLKNAMSWNTQQKFRLRYSNQVFNHISFELLKHPHWQDDIGDFILLQWLWKNTKYFVQSITYKQDGFSAAMFVTLRDAHQGDPDWTTPLDRVLDAMPDDIDI